MSLPRCGVRWLAAFGIQGLGTCVRALPIRSIQPIEVEEVQNVHGYGAQIEQSLPGKSF